MERFPGKEQTGQIVGAGCRYPGDKLKDPWADANCPLCQLQFRVDGTQNLAEVTCPSCGLQFSLEPHTKAGLARRQEPVLEDSRKKSDLDRWLTGEPMQFRRLTDRQRLVQWCRRRPHLSGLLVAATLTVLTAATVGAVGYCYTSLQLRSIDRQRRSLQQRCVQAESVAARRTRLAAEKQRLATSEISARREAEQRLKVAERCRMEAVRDRARAEQQTAVTARDARLALARQLAHQSQHFLLDGSPNRSLFLAGESLRVELQEGIHPTNRLTEQTLRDAMALVGQRGLVGHEGPVQAVAISPDGRWLVSGSSDNTARLWDLSCEAPTASSTVLRGHRGQVSVVAISPNGHWLVTAGDAAIVMLWNLTAADPSAEPTVLQGHHGRIHALAMSADGRWLVTASGGNEVEDNWARLWDLGGDDPATSMSILRGHSKPIRAVAISSDGHWVATAGDDQTVRLWNLTAQYPAAEQIVLGEHDGRVESLVVSPDSRWLVSGSYDNTARLWDLRTTDPSREATVLRGHRSWVTTLAISHDGRWLATGSFDKTVRLWNLKADDPSLGSTVLEGHEGRIRAAAFSPDGRWLITGSFDRTVRLWDLKAENPSAAPTLLRGHTGPINTIAVSPDGRWLATGGEGNSSSTNSVVRLWDLRMEPLLDTARTTAARHLDFQQRQDLLLEAAKRSQSPQ